MEGYQEFLLNLDCNVQIWIQSENILLLMLWYFFPRSSVPIYSFKRHFLLILNFNFGLITGAGWACIFTSLHWDSVQT